MVSESNDAIYAALAAGDVDAVIDDSPKAWHFSQTVDGLEFRGPIAGTAGEYAILLRRGNDGLKLKIDQQLEAMERDGTLKTIQDRWFGDIQLA